MKRLVYSLLVFGSVKAQADITTDEKVLAQIENTQDFDEPEKWEWTQVDIDEDAVEDRQNTYKAKKDMELVEVED